MASSWKLILCILLYYISVVLCNMLCYFCYWERQIDSSPWLQFGVTICNMKGQTKSTFLKQIAVYMDVCTDTYICVYVRILKILLELSTRILNIWIFLKGGYFSISSDTRLQSSHLQWCAELCGHQQANERGAETDSVYEGWDWRKGKANDINESCSSKNMNEE